MIRASQILGRLHEAKPGETPDENLPDFIHPNRKKALKTKQHPFGKNEAIHDLADKLAKESYSGTVKKLQKYAQAHGMPTDAHGIGRMLMRTLHQVLDFEKGHEQELENLVKQLVLSLDEFKTAAEAVKRGDLILIAELVPMGEVDLSGAQAEADDSLLPNPDLGLDVPEIASEMNLEVEKRRLVNLMIQGNAVHKAYAYHMVDKELNKINPNLLGLYGLLQSCGDLMYWADAGALEAMMMRDMDNGGGEESQAAGAERIEADEDGTPIIHAQGVNFVVLVHELVKGMMEYLSHQEEDQQIRQHVQGQADTLKHETWDMTLGPAAWQRVLDMIGDDRTVMPYVYDHLTALSAGEFHRVMREILHKTSAGQHYVQKLVGEIKAEQEGNIPEAPADEPEAEPEEDSSDWWKKESKFSMAANIIDEDLKTRYLKQRFAKPTPACPNPVTDEEIKAAASADPTAANNKHAYTEWILALMRKGDIHIEEDREMLLELLAEFDKFKVTKAFQTFTSNNILTYKTFADLRQKMVEFKEKHGRGEVKIEEPEEVADGVTLLSAVGEYRLYLVTNAEWAAKKWEKCAWCTRHVSTFSSSQYGGRFWYITFRGQPFALLHPETAQLKDVHNGDLKSKYKTEDFVACLAPAKEEIMKRFGRINSVSKAIVVASAFQVRTTEMEPEILRSHQLAIYAGSLHDRIPEFEAIIFRSPQMSSEYGITRRERIPEIEEKIFKDPAATLHYALNLGVRIPEAEKVIFSDASKTLKYVEKLKQRIPEAEKTLASSAKYSSEYMISIGQFIPEMAGKIAENPILAIELAEKVIPEGMFVEGSKRWPAAEAAIAAQGAQAYAYAKDVVKGRWPEGEPAMAKSTVWSLNYATQVLKGPFPLAEELLGATRPSAYAYATSVIKRRWAPAEKLLHSGGSMDFWAKSYCEAFPDAKADLEAAMAKTKPKAKAEKKPEEE